MNVNESRHRNEPREKYDKNYNRLAQKRHRLRRIRNEKTKRTIEINYHRANPSKAVSLLANSAILIVTILGHYLIVRCVVNIDKLRQGNRRTMRRKG